MSRKYVLVVAWLLLAAIVFVTLAPVQWRPRTGHPNLERFAAFLLLGAAYTLALPRRAGLIAVCVVLGAFALEAAQWFSPTRDPAVKDALVKACGALVGVAAGRWIDGAVAGRRAERGRPGRLA
jgi:VanZ family protein